MSEIYILPNWLSPHRRQSNLLGGTRSESAAELFCHLDYRFADILSTDLHQNNNLMQNIFHTGEIVYCSIFSIFVSIISFLRTFKRFQHDH